jgi:hypothetical protein
MRGRGREPLPRELLRLLGLSALALVIGLLLSAPVLAQCSMCKSTVVQSPEGRQMAEKLNAAILVMFFAPYLVFGTVATIIFRSRIALLVTRVLRLLFLPR